MTVYFKFDTSVLDRLSDADKIYDKEEDKPWFSVNKFFPDKTREEDKILSCFVMFFKDKGACSSNSYVNSIKVAVTLLSFEIKNGKKVFNFKFLSDVFTMCKTTVFFQGRIIARTHNYERIFESELTEEQCITLGEIKPKKVSYK